MVAVFLTLSYSWDTSKCYQATFRDIPIVGNIPSTFVTLDSQSDIDFGDFNSDHNITVSWDASTLQLSIDAPEHWLWKSVPAMAFMYTSWGPIYYDDSDGMYNIKDNIDKIVTVQTVDRMVKDKNGTVIISGKLMRDYYQANTYDVSFFLFLSP